MRQRVILLAMSGPDTGGPEDSVAPRTGLSLMTEPAFAVAALPLFEAGEVDALEWSFDTGWGAQPPPEWALALLDDYAFAGRLTGHGVTYSPLSARFTARQRAWLERLRVEVRSRRYVRLSEHFGCVTAGDLVDGAPLPVPFSPAAVAIGRDRLARLADAAGVPVGLENLALAFSRRDVDAQGDFLEALLAPVHGFLVLDLHNLYCHSVNFDVPAADLLRRYPLDRVRSLHLSGGSLQAGIRRDTHDSAVPPAVLALLPEALAACPRVDTVILERLGHSVAKDPPGTLAREFRAIKRIVDAHRPGSYEPVAAAPPALTLAEPPPEDAALARLQERLLAALEAGATGELAAASPDWLAEAEPRMLAVAGELVRTWSRRST